MNRKVMAVLSVPWCCVVSVSFALVSTTGSVVGVVFDQWFHSAMWYVIPLLSVTHLYGIYRYVRHPHKTVRVTVIMMATTMLFAISVGFHFTDVHDVVMGQGYEHHEH